LTRFQRKQRKKKKKSKKTALISGGDDGIPVDEAQGSEIEGDAEAEQSNNPFDEEFAVKKSRKSKKKKESCSRRSV